MAIQHYFDRAKVDYDEVYEAGKKAEWNEFWDEFQQKGNRVAYNSAFLLWTDKLFYPKYDIRPTNAVQAFAQLGVANLTQRLKDCGVVLDLSGCTSMSETFAYSTILTHIPTVDCTSAASVRYIFANDRALVEIEKIVLKEDGSQDVTFTLNNCNKLEKVVIQGVIGSGNISAGASTKLNRDSIVSIINALSPTASGQTTTLSKTAVETAFGSTTSTEWSALVATKSNWTISLV